MDTTQMSIQPSEIRIHGNWTLINGRLVADSAANRIDYLVCNELDEVGRSDDGWSVLYLDRRDGRYWELTYPDSDMHGGGAPALDFLPDDMAAKKYKF